MQIEKKVHILKVVFLGINLKIGELPRTSKLCSFSFRICFAAVSGRNLTLFFRFLVENFQLLRFIYF